MPWSEGPRLRWRRLVEYMDRRNLDMVALGSQKNIFYFTGYLTRRIFLPTYLLVPKNGDPILITGRDDKEEASKTFGGEIVEYINYDLSLRMRPYPDSAVETLQKILGKRLENFSQIGIEEWGLDASFYRTLARMSPKASFHDISHDIILMRMRKDLDELEAIKKAEELNDFTYQAAKNSAKAGVSEVEVYAAAYSQLIKKVGGYIYFYGDLVSGDRCINIGGPPTQRILNDGETLILDLWVVWKNYWSDTCRTFIIGGRANPAQLKVYEVLKEALKAGEEKLRPGNTGAEVYQAVYKVIDKHGYGRFFPHHAGHGLGLEAWEPPYFIPSDTHKLVEGAVVALEPGVYFPEIGGIRLENNYLVKKDSVEQLNHFPLEP
jgi:Xaa-Pro dipeptidase